MAALRRRVLVPWRAAADAGPIWADGYARIRRSAGEDKLKWAACPSIIGPPLYSLPVSPSDGSIAPQKKKKDGSIAQQEEERESLRRRGFLNPVATGR